jgi:hypothetical protein
MWYHCTLIPAAHGYAASVGQWNPHQLLLSNAPALCQPDRGTSCGHVGPILMPDQLMVVQGKKEIAKALRVFVDHNNYPVLVHCIHGKDRTGLIVMLIMLLCSVEPEVSTYYMRTHNSNTVPC